jgi:hypothetical protein
MRARCLDEAWFPPIAFAGRTAFFLDRIFLDRIMSSRNCDGNVGTIWQKNPIIRCVGQIVAAACHSTFLSVAIFRRTQSIR